MIWFSMILIVLVAALMAIISQQQIMFVKNVISSVWNVRKFLINVHSAIMGMSLLIIIVGLNVNRINIKMLKNAKIVRKGVCHA